MTLKHIHICSEAGDNMRMSLLFQQNDRKVCTVSWRMSPDKCRPNPGHQGPGAARWEEVGTHQAFPLRTGLARRAYPAQQDFGPISLIGPKGKGKSSGFSVDSRVACMLGLRLLETGSTFSCSAKRSDITHMDCIHWIKLA